jgi:hypothetical protein
MMWGMMRTLEYTEISLVNGAAMLPYNTCVKLGLVNNYQEYYALVAQHYGFTNYVVTVPIR